MSILTSLIVIFLLYLNGLPPCFTLICDGLGPMNDNDTFMGHGFCKSAMAGVTYFKVSIGFPQGSSSTVLEDSSPSPFCYLVSDCLVTRAEAKAFCNARVGQLVMITSKYQKQLMKDLTAKITRSKRVYFTDMITGARNRWIWESTGALVPDELTRFKRQIPDDEIVSNGIDRSFNRIAYDTKFPDDQGYFICQQKPPTCYKRFGMQSTSATTGNKTEANEPNEQITPGDPSCYTLSTCMATLEVARSFCIQQGFGDLVGIEDLKEEHLISDLFKETFKNETNTTLLTAGVFLGNNANGSHMGWLSSAAFTFKNNVTYKDGSIITIGVTKTRSLAYQVVRPDQPFLFLCEHCKCQRNNQAGKCIYVGYDGSVKTANDNNDEQ